MNEFIHHLRADGTEAAPSLGHPVNGGATMAVALDDARIAVFSRPSTSSFEVDLEPWTKAGGGPGTHYLHSGMDGSILLADGRILVYGSTANLYNPLVRNTRRDAPAGPPAALVLDTTGLVRKSFPSMVRLLDGRVLISGGWGDTTANYESPFSRESYLFDPATSAFTHVGDRATVPNYPGLLPGESSDPGLASGAILLPDGRVLFLGVPVTNERAVNEIFDPVTGLFTVLGPAINELGRCEPVLLPNGQVLLGGAGDLAGFYDPATNRYHSLVGPAGAPLRADARARLRADALAKTRAALAGGSNHGQLLAASGNSASTASILLPDGRAVMPSLLSGSTTTEVFTPNLAVKVLPAVAWLNAGVSRTFSVELATPQSVAWSCLPADGAVLPDGTFSATRPGIYVLTATAQDGSKAHAFLHVQPQARLELSDLPYGPGVVQLYRAVNTLLRPSASRRFHAVVDHAQDQRVQWSVVEAGGGSVAWDGTYTAPATEGNYTLRAVSMADPSQVATLTITITTAPVSIFSFTATPSTVASGSNTTLRWALDGAVTAATLTSSRNETWNVLGLGQLTVTPLQPTTYTLTVSGPEGGATRSLPVQVTGYVRSLALSPTEATTDATQASPVFTVNIELAPGVDPTLVWSATGGTCTSTGPTTATWAPPGTPGDYLITATSVADPSVSATALVHLLPPQVVITLTPSYATVQPGQVFQFGVATNAGNVTWSADRGAITTDGWFTAPDSGTAIVTATSTMNPAIQETAAITIRPVDVVVAPSRIVILKNATYRFSGFASTGGLTWSVVEPGGGGIDATGLYTAPAVNGTFTVKAASALDGSRSATATVIVGDTGGSGSGGTGGGSPPPAPVSNGLSVNPQLALMRAGTYQSFSAEVWRVADQAVTWSVVGAPATAAIDADGVFTAGAPGTYVVKATSAVDGTVSGTSTVIMQSSVDAVEGVPADLATRQGYSVTALPNGKILLAGGWDGSAYVGSCYLFDPGARTFVPTASLAIPRSGHEATLLENGKVLITGGKGTVQWRPDWNPYTGPLFWGELYDPASGSFEPLPPNPAVPDSEAGQMQSFHHGGTGVALKDGRAFVIGGDTFPNQPNSKTSIFDPGTGVFTRDPLMFGHWTAAASLEDGRLLITGGWDANYDAFDPPPNDMNLKLSNQAWLYGPDAQGTWGMSPVPRSPEPG
jgi:hypothetical protein